MIKSQFKWEFLHNCLYKTGHLLTGTYVAKQKYLMTSRSYLVKEVRPWKSAMSFLYRCDLWYIWFLKGLEGWQWSFYWLLKKTSNYSY